jgi:hypothetical protein
MRTFTSDRVVTGCDELSITFADYAIRSHRQ